MLQLFFTKVVDEWGTSYSITPAGYAFIIAILICLLLAIGLMNQAERKRKINTKQLVFAAMAVALAMITSYLKVWDMPMGGSITLFSMLFISLIGYWYGLKIGLMTGVAYGLLQLIVDPYIISIPQVLTDYIFAFGSLGLSGIFTNSKHGLMKGYILGVLGRFAFTFLSGLIFFSSYAEGTGMSAVLYSFAYNGAYIGGESALTLILLAIPSVSKAFLQIKQIAINH